MERRTMELINNVTKEEYEAFVKNHPLAHFLQSYTWGEFERTTTSITPHYLGLKDDQNNYVAMALFLEKKLVFGYRSFYCPRGYILDYKNKDLVRDFTREIKKYAKKKKAIYVKINPSVKLQNLDTNGNIKTSEENNYDVVNFLKSLGYHHFGFPKNFENSEPRYTYCLDLTQGLESIQNNLHPTTKKIIKRGNPYQLELTKNDEAHIEDFYLTMVETAKREGILNHDMKYYKTFYEQLHKENMSDLYVVTANILTIRNIYEERIKDLTERIEQFAGKQDIKNKNKKQELQNQLAKAIKEYKIIQNIKEEKLVLSSILTAKYANTVWTVHGGNHSLLRELNANYFIYYEIIKDASKEGYEVIDFFGTAGNPKPDNPIYGIHLFKKRLGGEYIEFIGEFDLIINKVTYFFFTKLIPLYRNIKRNRLKRKEYK